MKRSECVENINDDGLGFNLVSKYFLCVRENPKKRVMKGGGELFVLLLQTDDDGGKSLFLKEEKG